MNHKSIFMTLVLAFLLISGGCGGKDAEEKVPGSVDSSSPERFSVADGRNDSVYASLAVAGMENALVDLTDERTIIGYELPRELDKEVALFYVLGAAARHTNPEATITTIAFQGGKASEEASVAAKDVMAFLNEEISLQECQARITRTGPLALRHGVTEPSIGVLAAPLLPAVSAQEDIEPAQATRCIRLLQEWQGQCNSAYFKELNTGPGYDFEKIKADCLLLAKKAFLRCIGRPKNSRYWDADRVEDEYNLWIKLVNPRRVAYVAPAIGKIGETILAGVPSGPVSLGGSPVSKVVGTLVGLGGSKVMEKVTEPLSEDEKKKKEGREEAAKSVESKLEDITLPVSNVVLENFFFVVIDPADATPDNIGDRPHTSYMAEYKPERYSETWQIYFPLTPVVQAAIYLTVGASDGPDRNVMGMGFNQAGLFAGEGTRPYQVWNQPAAGDEPRMATAGGNTPPETTVQQFVIEFPPDPLPTAEAVNEGPFELKGFAMPGGRNNPITPPERSVEQIDFQAKANTLYVLEVQPPADYLEWCVESTRTTSGRETRESCGPWADPPGSGRHERLSVEPGNHSIKISRWPGDPLSYTMTITGIPNDHGSGPDDATLVEIGVPVTGTLWDVGKIDWFTFAARAETTYELHLSLDPGTDLMINYLDVIKPDGTKKTGPFGPLNPLTFKAETTGLYTIELNDNVTLEWTSPLRPYTFTVTEADGR